MMRDKVFAFIRILQANGLVEISSVDVQRLMDQGALHLPAPVDKRWSVRKIGQYLKAAEKYGLIEFVEYRYNKVVGNMYKIKVYEFVGDTMMLKAKINREYLDQIISGNKSTEYRQIEGILLSDGNRTLEADVRSIKGLSLSQRYDVMRRYPAVRWKTDQQIFAFEIRPRKLWIGNSLSKVFDDEHQ
jgi:hypothetical protein